MIVTLHPGLFEPVSHFLASNDPQRSIRPHFAALFQFRKAGAKLVQHRPFLKPAPRRNQAQPRHTVIFRFVRRFEDSFAVNQIVAWSVRVIRGGLGAKPAIL